MAIAADPVDASSNLIDETAAVPRAKVDRGRPIAEVVTVEGDRTTRSADLDAVSADLTARMAEIQALTDDAKEIFAGVTDITADQQVIDTDPRVIEVDLRVILADLRIIVVDLGVIAVETAPIATRGASCHGVGAGSTATMDSRGRARLCGGSRRSERLLATFTLARRVDASRKGRSVGRKTVDAEHGVQP